MPLQVLTALLPRDIRSLSAGLNYPPSAPTQSSRDHLADKFADDFLTMVSTTPSTESREHRRHSTRRVALGFDPDCFLDERVNKYLILNPFIFLLFDAGPRICLGQQVCPLLLLWFRPSIKLRVASLRTTRYRS
jgi:hypothetical protein